MPERLRFVLLDGDDAVRSFDFESDTVQIGADRGRGDHLVLDLPRGLKHIRALVSQTGEYVECEILLGPVFLLGTQLDEGDVVQLTHGDILAFGDARSGPRLRFEEPTEEQIVLDDTADWRGGSRKRRKVAADDEFLFDEEEDKYAGKNAWQRYLIWYRERYAGFAKWRKKAARVKYWFGLAQMITKKAQGFVGIGLALAAGGIGMYTQYTAKEEALATVQVQGEQLTMAVEGERAAHGLVREVEQAMKECGCAPTGGTAAEGEVADLLLERFGEDKRLNFERSHFLPDQSSESYAGLLVSHYNAAKADRRTLPRTMDRVCSATADKERMNHAVQQALSRDLHEAYLFVPFVESHWCELAVSHTGPRGMMQFTRSTAKRAWAATDASQANIPSYPWTEHRAWLKQLANERGYGGYYGLLARCSALDRAAYKQKFYPGPGNPSFPKRLDPADPRTDWESSTEAAVAWLASLHSVYAGRGWREFDAILLAMSAYNQGEREVQQWIKRARAHYGRESEAALDFVEIVGGGLLHLQDETDPERRRQIEEGLRYAPKVLGAYLVAAPMLDERNCRN